MGIGDRESRYEKTGVYMLIICQTWFLQINKAGGCCHFKPFWSALKGEFYMFSFKYLEYN